MKIAENMLGLNTKPTAFCVPGVVCCVQTLLQHFSICIYGVGMLQCVLSNAAARTKFGSDNKGIGGNKAVVGTMRSSIGQDGQGSHSAYSDSDDDADDPNTHGGGARGGDDGDNSSPRDSDNSSPRDNDDSSPRDSDNSSTRGGGSGSPCGSDNSSTRGGDDSSNRGGGSGSNRGGGSGSNRGGDNSRNRGGGSGSNRGGGSGSNRGDDDVDNDGDDDEPAEPTAKSFDFYQRTNRKSSEKARQKIKTIYASIQKLELQLARCVEKNFPNKTKRTRLRLDSLQSKLSGVCREYATKTKYYQHGSFASMPSCWWAQSSKEGGEKYYKHPKHVEFVKQVMARQMCDPENDEFFNTYEEESSKWYAAWAQNRDRKPRDVANTWLRDSSSRVPAANNEAQPDMVLQRIDPELYPELLQGDHAYPRAPAKRAPDAVPRKKRKKAKGPSHQKDQGTRAMAAHFAELAAQTSVQEGGGDGALGVIPIQPSAAAGAPKKRARHASGPSHKKGQGKMATAERLADLAAQSAAQEGGGDGALDVIPIQPSAAAGAPKKRARHASGPSHKKGQGKMATAERLADLAAQSAALQGGVTFKCCVCRTFISCRAASWSMLCPVFSCVCDSPGTMCFCDWSQCRWHEQQ